MEWEYLKRDLDALEGTTVNNAERTFVIRSQPRGNAAKALQAAGVALAPTVRLCE